MVCSYEQGGYGITDIGPRYRSPGIVQRGSGVGSIFAGLLKYLKPLGKTLGTQALSAGRNIVRDVADGKNIRDALYDSGQQSIRDLAEKGVTKLQKMQRGRGLLTRTLVNASLGEGRVKKLSMVRKKRTSRKKKRLTRGAKKLPAKKKVQKGGRRKRQRKVKRKVTKRQRTVDIFGV